MTDGACPRCGENTEQKVIRQKRNTDLIWCQHCYHVRFDKWDFAVPFEPMALTVHVETLDNDHLHLMEMINNIHSSKENSAQSSEKFKTFLKKTGEHFKREEGFLRRIGYPDLDAHRRHHGEVFAEINKNITAYRSEDTISASNIIFLLKCCLMDLLLEDMKYKEKVAAGTGLPAKW